MIKGLKGESPVLKFFADLTDIPRCSKNEEEISNYLKKWALDRDLEVIQDDVNNIIIKKPASEGYENEPTTILQGHMDMVCVAVKGHEHNFCSDPIEAVVEGDRIIAKNTTLGADDGIAVAMMLAILDGDYPHPALECLITVDEETNMTGAHNVEGKYIEGRRLINIDSEEEGIITVGCAGGLVNNVVFKKEFEETDKATFLKVELAGLRGGHSGSDIHEARGNAILLLARILKMAYEDHDFDIADFHGGTRPNVIPQDAEAIIALESAEVDGVVKTLNQAADIIKSEYIATDPKAHLTIKEVPSQKVLVRKVSDGILNYLVTTPNGVNTFSKKIEGLVESSTNIGAAISSEDSFAFSSQIRSDVETKILEIAMKNRTAAEVNGGVFEKLSAYKPWEYAEESPLREKAVKLWKDLTGEEPTVEMIHAGLECGILQDSIGKMDMISIGPDMEGVHAPGENLSIQSTEKVFVYLLKLLEQKG